MPEVTARGSRFHVQTMEPPSAVVLVHGVVA
jgi:hypothetical protein